jgi:hypothetical protein
MPSDVPVFLFLVDFLVDARLPLPSHGRRKNTTDG